MNTELLFWFSSLFILYTYLGYPFFLYVFALLRPQGINKKHVEDPPSVSVVIAVKDEASRISRRLANLCTQEYPLEKLEIIVVSDGSLDETEAIVRQFQEQKANTTPAIRLIVLSESLGKAMALNAGVGSASGEIIIFTDSRQTFAPDTIRELSANFYDTAVGCASGELLFVENHDSKLEVEMGVYWRYEKMIRRFESATGSVVGATGAVYGIRRALYSPMPKGTLLDDVYCPLQCYLRGGRVIFDGKARAYDTVSDRIKTEWKRKVRTLAGNWQLFSLIKELHNPLSFSLWWKFFSHKVARLLVPFLLPVVFVTSAASQGSLYSALVILQILFYSLVLAAAAFPNLRKQRIVGLSYFFFVLNWAALVGWWRWLRGDLEKCWR